MLALHKHTNEILVYVVCLCVNTPLLLLLLYLLARDCRNKPFPNFLHVTERTKMLRVRFCEKERAVCGTEERETDGANEGGQGERDSVKRSERSGRE